MKRLLRKALRWAGILLATLIVLLLAFYAEEDWRGARDWAACQRDLAARGETLDLRQLIPPGKPEDDLSKVPIFAEMYQENAEEQKWGKSTIRPRIRQIKTHLKPSNDGYVLPKQTYYAKGEPIDLVAWQKYYRATPEAHLLDPIGTPANDVLQAFVQFDSSLKEINLAVSNPNVYWPAYSFSQSGVPTYMGDRVAPAPIAKVLELKAVAHLESNDSQEAEDDYQFCFRLSRPIAQGDYINWSVTAAIRESMNTILWEGLRRHAWSAAQLHDMESALASLDMLAFAAESFRVDRASMLGSMQDYQNMDRDVVSQSEYNDFYFDFYLYDLPISLLRPNGWWNQDRVSLCEGMQQHIDAIDLKNGTMSSGEFPFHDMSNSWGWNRAETDLWRPIYTSISALVFSFVDDEGPRIARAETYRRLARLACRLEEYRLAHNNQYPDQLDNLPDLPPHLNQEVLSTQPLHYHRQGDGYTLYSLGWNQKDDGGTYNPDPKQGDWPWPSP